MRKMGLILTLLTLAICSLPLTAQEDIESMYMRKAVKDFVARDYDATIGDLEQALTANAQNEKARKLLAKTYARKGEQALAQNNNADAMTFFSSSLEYDAANADAQKGLSIVKQRQAAQQQAAAARAAELAQSRAAEQGAPTIIQTAPAEPTFKDSAQAKAFESLISVMNQNQKIIAQQIEQSNSLVNKSDNNKDKYLDALMMATKQSNDRMLRYILIGGGVAVLFLIIFVAVFFIFFYSVNKSSELRTIQAAQNYAALLAAPGAGANGAQPLLLTGPQGSTPDQQAPQVVGGQEQPVVMTAGQPQGEPVSAVNAAIDEKTEADIEQLNNDDPIKRAQAVEAVEAEIIESKESVRIEKIKKLGELLKDENNRVRANAAKAIYEIDKEASLTTLNDMLRDSSKRMRASAIWALGEIGSEDAMELLLRIENESDEMITYNIKMALEKIRNAKRFPLSSSQLERIDAEVQKYKEMD
jgi:hypothetical protein